MAELFRLVNYCNLPSCQLACLRFCLGLDALDSLDLTLSEKMMWYYTILTNILSIIPSISPYIIIYWCSTPFVGIWLYYPCYTIDYMQFICIIRGFLAMPNAALSQAPQSTAPAPMTTMTTMGPPPVLCQWMGSQMDRTIHDQSDLGFT